MKVDDLCMYVGDYILYCVQIYLYCLNERKICLHRIVYLITFIEKIVLQVIRI